MVTAVAHSFRNPLSVIRSSAELAAEMPESPDTPRTLNEIIRHVDRLDQEVRDLLGYFPRGNEGLQPLPVNEVVTAAAKVFDTQFARRGITPSMQLRQPSLVARSNAASLSKVVDNAIANAVEAMPEGGTLTLKVEPATDRRFIEIRVIDTGHGIDGQAMPQIGKPFVTTKKKGLGLGLTLSRSIMEGLGGSFELRSAAGIGTEAIIRVPAAS
jgi:two-component system sensor histidine kinase HydH